MIVAIDGPAGAGKSTVARRLAERLGGSVRAHERFDQRRVRLTLANTPAQERADPRQPIADGVVGPERADTR